MVQQTWYVTLDGHEYHIYTTGRMGGDLCVVEEGGEPLILNGHLSKGLIPFAIGPNHTGQISEGTWLHFWMNRRLYIDGYDAETGDALPTPVNHICVGAVSGLLGFLFGLLILIPMLICCCICCFVHRNDVYRIPQVAEPKHRHGEETVSSPLLTEPEKLKGVEFV